MLSMWLVLVAYLLVVLSPHIVHASAGDRAWIYQKCLRSCEGERCSRISDEAYAAKQPMYERLLRWTCNDDCKYTCMWKTVDAFRMDDSHVPQFYGKWPFTRFLGIQEPASMFFSLLNGLANLVMLFWLRRKVPSSAPMYYIWHVYSLVAVNAWLWAFIFHTRDQDFTEMMDYVSAVSLVFFSLFCLCARIFYDDKPKMWICGAILGSFFTYHTYYLSFVHFDYGYNMQVNVLVGIVNAVGWIGWCIRSRKNKPYVWKAAVSIMLISSLILLELGDFPPLLWVFDAHSLWHAGTVPIPLVWYSFIIDDSLYMLKQRTGDLIGKKAS